jgi:hypothetical protein
MSNIPYKPPESRWEDETNSLFLPLEGSSPADSLISDLSPPELLRQYVLLWTTQFSTLFQESSGNTYTHTHHTFYLPFLKLTTFFRTFVFLQILSFFITLHLQPCPLQNVILLTDLAQAWVLCEFPCDSQQFSAA